jgi:hypothetical protein
MGALEELEPSDQPWRQARKQALPEPQVRQPDAALQPRPPAAEPQLERPRLVSLREHALQVALRQAAALRAAQQILSAA